MAQGALKEAGVSPLAAARIVPDDHVKRLALRVLFRSGLRVRNRCKKTASNNRNSRMRKVLLNGALIRRMGRIFPFLMAYGETCSWRDRGVDY